MDGHDRALPAEPAQGGLGRPPDGERPLRQAAAANMRWVRLVAIGFVVVQSWLYQPPAGLALPFPRWTLPLVVAAVALATNALGAVAARHPDLRWVRAGARLEIAVDALVVLGLTVAFAFDADSQLWALLVLPAMEAAWREQLRGALLAWAGLAAGYLGRDVWAAQAFEHVELRVDSVSYRTGLVLTVTLVAGLLARSLHHANAGHAAANAELTRQAITDSLTGVANRRHFLQVLAADLAAHRPVAVIFFDVDGFKTVNDTLGHQLGDELLTITAARLVGALDEGTMVGRFGGDEFLVLLRDVADPNLAEETARRLQVAVHEPVALAGREMRLTASAGVAVSEDGSVTPGALLRDADLAMYEAKHDGRGGVATFAPSMGRRLRRRLELEHGLRQALRDDGLDVVYQPIVRTDGGQVAGVEALLRWTHPSQGPIPPAEVIEVAADLGLGDELAGYVLDRALADAARWWRQVPGLFVSVNFGPRQVHDADATTQRLLDGLAGYGLPPEALLIEATETAVLDDRETQLQTFLSHVRARGVRVAVDDFGRGHSSLARLRELPFDLLKLDRGLIDDLDEPGSDPIVLEAVVLLAHGLGHAVIAEGVETERQHEAVRRVGCELVQGLGVAEPRDAAALTRWLRDCAGTGDAHRSA